MARNRPQRPGTPPATTAPGDSAASRALARERERRRRERERRQRQQQQQQRQASGAPTESDETTTGTTSAVGPKPNKKKHPNQYQRWKKAKQAAEAGNGDASDLQTDSGQLTANDPANWQPYFNKMLGAGGLTAGAPTAFGQWLQNEAYDQFEQAYKSAMLDNNDLTFTDFATQTYGDVGAGAVRGVGGPIGVGQPMGSPPIDTGNPFTSSSGIGYTGNRQTVESTSAQTTPSFKDYLAEQGIKKPKGGFNQGRKNRLQEQYNAFLGTQQNATAPAAPVSPAATLDDFRRKFLSYDPETRGEQVMGAINTPARWSAWG